MNTDRPKVLVSAYACHPEPSTAHFPGEAILGWHLAKEIAGFADLHLITWAFNREGVEGTLTGGDGRPAKVHYVDLPRRLHETLRDRHLGTRIYYYLWQRAAAKAGRRAPPPRGLRPLPPDHLLERLDAELHRPRAARPVRLGPDRRRTESAPRADGDDGPPRPAPGEVADLPPERLARDPSPAPRRRKASAILVCNKETKDVLSRWRDKIVDFPVNGIRREDIPPGPTPGREPRRVPRFFTSAASIPSRACRSLSRPCASSPASPPPRHSSSSAKARSGRGSKRWPSASGSPTASSGRPGAPVPRSSRRCGGATSSSSPPCGTGEGPSSSRPWPTACRSSASTWPARASTSATGTASRSLRARPTWSRPRWPAPSAGSGATRACGPGWAPRPATGPPRSTNGAGSARGSAASIATPWPAGAAAGGTPVILALVLWGMAWGGVFTGPTTSSRCPRSTIRSPSSRAPGPSSPSWPPTSASSGPWPRGPASASAGRRSASSSTTARSAWSPRSSFRRTW